MACVGSRERGDSLGSVTERLCLAEGLYLSAIRAFGCVSLSGSKFLSPHWVILKSALYDLFPQDRSLCHAVWNGSCSSCKRSADGFTDDQTMIGQSLIPLRVTGLSLVAWQNVACLFEHGHLLYARNAYETAHTHTHTPVRSHEQTFTAERQRCCGVIEEWDCLSVSPGIWGSTGDQRLNAQLSRTEQEAFRFRDWTERKATDLRLFRAREFCLHPGFRCSWHLSV